MALDKFWLFLPKGLGEGVWGGGGVQWVGEQVGRDSLSNVLPAAGVCCVLVCGQANITRMVPIIEKKKFDCGPLLLNHQAHSITHWTQL